jgi:hypothetical protein
VNPNPFLEMQKREPQYAGGKAVIVYQNRTYGINQQGRIVRLQTELIDEEFKLAGGKTQRVAMRITVNVNATLCGEDGMSLHRNDTLYIPHDAHDDANWRAVPPEIAVRIKHLVLRQQRAFDRMRREVEAFENMEKLGSREPREPIPDSIRLFVWQRDQSRCVKCGQREKLEFDHIIPIVAGGSNTDRNIQLLCESCNRSKGATI